MDRLRKIGKLLQKIDADVVVLNEVDFDCSWSHGVNQAAVLAELAGYPYRIEQRNLDFRVLGWRWKFGNAILSRYPIDGVLGIDLPGYSKWETEFAGQKRGVLCEVHTDSGYVRVIAAHLCHRSEDVRVASAELLNQFDFPTIIAGDFNSTPPDFPRSGADANGANAIATLDASGLFKRSPMTAPAAAGRTFRSQEPVSTIDWILIPIAWEFTGYEVIDSQLSDHRPVVADIRMNP